MGTRLAVLPITVVDMGHALARKYDESMNKRITVSLPEHLVDQALSAVADGRAKSVSAYVARALEQAAPRESLADVLDEWVREAPPLTAEDEVWVDDALAAAQRASRR